MLAEHVSPPLGEDVRLVNKMSLNLHAELLLRVAAKEKGGALTLADALQFSKTFFQNAGMPDDSAVMSDGSGLSRRDLVTPRGVVWVFEWAAKQPWAAGVPLESSGRGRGRHAGRTDEGDAGGGSHGGKNGNGRARHRAFRLRDDGARRAFDVFVFREQRGDARERGRSGAGCDRDRDGGRVAAGAESARSTGRKRESGRLDGEKKEKVITVFGSSRPREGQPDYETARELGRRLAEHGFAVCSGGYGGVMEAVSRGAKESGGRVVGVTAKTFHSHTNRWVDEEIRVESWRDRLFELIRRGDGYVACKGGTGTLAELAVVWEMQNKGLMRGAKPFVMLGHFWTPVLELMTRWSGSAARIGTTKTRWLRAAATPRRGGGISGRAAAWERRMEREARSPHLSSPCPAPHKTFSNSTGVRELVRRETTCALGRRAVEALEFSTDRARLVAEFALIAESVEYLRAGNDLGFGALPDPEEWLAKLEAPGVVLVAAELLDAASLADTAEWLSQDFRASAAKAPLLAARAGSIADLRPLRREIRRTVLPSGEISDDASPELKRIRSSLGRAREGIQKTLERILRERGLPPGEDYVTLRNDRFVIPVRAAERRAVQGVVHAASATGQTLFVEPLETVELNNKLVQLREDEHAEIARLLESLTRMLQDARGPLRAAVAVIAELDSIFARGRYARRLDCALPEFSGEISLSLRSARHPVLDDALRRQGRAAVPFHLDLGGGETVLVISGPNTGGKTVALKTVGLAALAAQSGIPVAAESARLPIFQRVLADIGDEQSIAADLSTFSAHMLNLRAMLEAAGPSSLVLADEMGTGTAPEEGAALAVALLDAFRARGCLTLATTHHDRLKSYAAATPGVVNASVEFDAVALRPTYRLRVGVPGGSSGIDIASRLGLPAEILDHARSLLTPESREAADLIAYLHRTCDRLELAQREAASQARELETERKLLQTEWVERQKKAHRGTRT